MIRALLFDCFGVLVGKGLRETYRSAGGDPLADRPFINDVLGKANLGLISQAEFDQAIADRLTIALSDWLGIIRQVEQLNVELLEYIEKLRESFKTAILSNANTGVVQRRLGKDWLDRCFDAVFVSAEVGKVKPDPEIYALAATRLGVQPAECILLDDLQRYVQAAEVAGMQGIVYQDFNQAKLELEKLL